MKQPCVIIDIDGTAANNDHRQHHLNRDNGRKPDWDAFFSEMDKDTVNTWCAFLADCLETHMPVFLCTGRFEKHRKVTKKWLDDNEVTHTKMYMRADGDTRPDDVIKEEIYRKHIEPFYDVLFVVDDRKRVVEMWRRIGLTCLQCAPGEF